MVGVFAKSPGAGRAGAATRRSGKHFLEDRVGSKRISPTAALQNYTSPFDSFGPAEEPEEPFETDQPARCPVSEPSISEDGVQWRARIHASLQRRNDILIASKERDAVFRGGSFPNRRTQNRSEENFLFVAHSAPENQVKKLLE